MVLRADVLFDALDAVPNAARPLLALTPSGRPFTQARARDLAAGTGFSLLCGRYEGFDERVLETAVDEEVSVGDFVLAGGELAALCLFEAVVRLLPGLLGNDDSSADESFSAGLLEYPQYTKPAEVRGLAVPDVLRSGDHARVERWRRARALERTKRRRPDLYAAYELTDADRRALADFLRCATPTPNG
jgi:tRNA (guanine37-N1)-methyltransferase